MRIQNNIAALNSHRQLGANNTAVGKNLEKLSSGYRINRAGDDAAGLAISEKMRAQIKGLETATKNANDGISLVQTAEGALTEVHSMLNRMTELATQSANGTYDNEVDRANLQKEVDSLKSEIDRISEGTNFNGINLLDGSLATKAGANTVKTVTASGAPANVAATGGATFTQDITLTSAGTADTDNTLSVKYLDKDGNAQNAEITFKGSADIKDTATNAAAELQKVFGDNYTVASDGTTGKITITAKNKGADQTQIISATQKEGTTTNAATAGAVTAGKNDVFTVIGATVAADVSKENFIEVDGTKFQILTKGQKAAADAKALYIDQTSGSLNADSAKQIAAQLQTYGVNASVNATTNTSIDISKDTADSAAKGGLSLQIGDTAESFNQLTVSVKSMSTTSLGIDALDISTQDGAAKALDKIKSAINTVSSTRGDLGAVQNRLEHTINNLSVTSENMTAAESRIRDVDMAKEMMNFTKNNILTQASQAMLAQANQLPQGVLQLLQ